MTACLITAAVVGWLLAMYLFLGFRFAAHQMMRVIDELRAQRLAVYDVIRPDLARAQTSWPQVTVDHKIVIPQWVRIARAVGVPEDRLPPWVRPGWGDFTPEEAAALMEEIEEIRNDRGGLGD